MRTASTFPLAKFARAVRDSRVLRPEQAQQLRGLASLCREPRDLARALLDRDWLTPFQVNEINRGRGQTLTMGPYVLVGRLGRGGMGTVFKALHARMRRLAAVKVLHPGILDRFGGRGRFLREVQSAARLDHPNVVH